MAAVRYTYVVTYSEPRLVTELVEAASAREAIRLVKQGLGAVIASRADTARNPTSYRATRDSAEGLPE